METLLTPEDVNALFLEKNKEKIAEFNRLVKLSIDSGNYYLRLNFDQWGHSLVHIKFIRDAGWHVTRDSAGSWWEIDILNNTK